jgi:hypothetical protein
MRTVFTHAVAVFVGLALGACSLAFAGRSVSQSAPTHADMSRVIAELHEMSLSTKALNNTTYHGFWTQCRLHFGYDDSAAIARWCN